MEASATVRCDRAVTSAVRGRVLKQRSVWVREDQVEIALVGRTELLFERLLCLSVGFQSLQG